MCPQQPTGLYVNRVIGKAQATVLVSISSASHIIGDIRLRCLAIGSNDRPTLSPTCKEVILDRLDILPVRKSCPYHRNDGGRHNDPVYGMHFSLLFL